jgi:type IV pilus assembly protein PilP
MSAHKLTVRTKTRPVLALLALVVLAMLAGCGDNDVKEVKQWMAQVKSETKVAVAPLAEPKTFIPFAYTGKDVVDPFSNSKLLVELAKVAAMSNNPLKPDTNRRKELLETFPLDTMHMVGVLRKAGVNYALVQIDKAVFQVTVGMRLGQNFGQVTGVTESTVALKEVVQDAAGDWVERLSKLELQEGKETKK